MIKYFSLLSLLLYLSGEMYAQRTEVYAPHIQTVQVIANDNYLAPPIITLGRGENIEISFDELSHEYHRYQSQKIAAGRPSARGRVGHGGQ